MADFIKNLQGLVGNVLPQAASSAVSDADDFADFATAAAPVAPSHAASSAYADAATTGSPGTSPLSSFAGAPGRPYTKWYRVWERTTIRDFYQELAIIPILIIIVIVSLFGTRANKRRAQQWAATNLRLLRSEYAVVGFGGGNTMAIQDDAQGKASAHTAADIKDVPAKFFKQKSQSEYTTYCTGRQNVACLDIKLSLYKRHSPGLWLGETVLSFFFDSIPPPAERLEATAHCFDGKEKALVPVRSTDQPLPSVSNSTFDGFVWAIVHKDKMKRLRDERYDLSLTSTKDHPKLPVWVTVMTESAEVTDTLLTPELIKAVNEAGEDLEALIISDQPIDAPKKLDDLVPKKRVSVSLRLNTSSSSLFAYFLRIPDQLVSSARFRPEALRKIKAVREDEARKLRKIDEDEKAEERRLATDKLKKEERDRKLSTLNADEQRKFLEKEKEKEQRKLAKKRTTKA